MIDEMKSVDERRVENLNLELKLNFFLWSKIEILIEIQF